MPAVSRQHIRIFATYVFILVIVVVLAFFYVWEYTSVTELLYKQERANRDLAALKAKNRELRLRAMTADSLAKVEKEAARLGLSEPDRGQVIVLSDPQIVGGESAR
jgi:cell division protein FtsB